MPTVSRIRIACAIYHWPPSIDKFHAFITPLPTFCARSLDLQETYDTQSLILEFNPIRKPATLRSERYCYGDKEYRADPEEARRVVCSRSDFTAPTGQAGQLLVVKLCAGEAIAKVSGHAGTTGSCNCAALQNCSITRVLSATLLSLVNKIINKKRKKIAKTCLFDDLKSLMCNLKESRGAIERSLDLSTSIVTNVLTRSTTVSRQPTGSNQNPWTLSKVKQPTRLSLLSKLVEARSQYLDSDRLKHRNPP
ncbi:hypothetical protein ALC57_16703 [Trachymyrmex cornetzi]|uniref:Uncharacterized protein n=1 Tax=Trachymyrmex cornetzi TaxID=471704 RepID=A0A195DFD5_9HYME|nr:hypothetical protein ALC57_16703 [Trachymyrmex cornetzi]